MMQKGVVKVVITDTATIIGYKKLLITPRLMPREAIIKENSPICARLKPQCTEVLRLWPEASTPPVEKISLPIIVATTSTKIGSACSRRIAGSTIMPTDTKKTAPNKSLIGATRCSIFSALGASAIKEPMMKAPKAEEKPS